MSGAIFQLLAAGSQAKYIKYITKTKNSSSFNSKLTASSSIQAGDLLILGIYGNCVSSASVNLPAGYTLITSRDGSDCFALAYKIAVSGDAGATVSWTYTQSEFKNLGVLHVFRNEAAALTAVTVSGAAAVYAGAAPAMPTVLGTGKAAPLIQLLFAVQDNSNTGTSLATQTGYVSASQSVDSVLCYNIVQVGGVPEDNTATVSDQGTFNCGMVCTLELT